MSITVSQHFATIKDINRPKSWTAGIRKKDIYQIYRAGGMMNITMSQQFATIKDMNRPKSWTAGI